MRTILVTGSAGFIGKNLLARLNSREDLKITCFDRDSDEKLLDALVEGADFIYHIAGVNRPKNDSEFTTGNKDLTEHIISVLDNKHKNTPILITSSIQAELDNPYGISKKAAENALRNWHKKSGAPVYLYRLPGVFGKWSRPNYNSVVATFCHNIANNLPITISDPEHVITLAYIDDVIDDFIKRLDNVGENPDSLSFLEVPRTFEISLGELSERIKSLHDIHITSVVPDLNDLLNKFLYATYISYLPKDDIAYSLTKNTDNRGWLAEFIKSSHFGQIFVSTTNPGITRGEHWHNTKIEKFLVVSGKADITLRNKADNTKGVLRFSVTGEDAKVVDMPVGYVHAITNTGTSDLITLFWADEILDKDRPDTNYEKV